MTATRYYATGKRKTAVARVWLQPGSGRITVNDQEPEVYFGGGFTHKGIERPLELTETGGRFDILATVRGGGKVAQASALCHGIAKALLGVDAEHRLTLKKAGLLTRDPRAKERKKYGQRSARARFQYSKR
ncbi:MAG: 30S ribosomal protein S9 [Thermodesulfobacteriota bacterium]